MTKRTKAERVAFTVTWMFIAGMPMIFFSLMSGQSCYRNAMPARCLIGVFKQPLLEMGWSQYRGHSTPDRVWIFYMNDDTVYTCSGLWHSPACGVSYPRTDALLHMMGYPTRGRAFDRLVFEYSETAFRLVVVLAVLHLCNAALLGRRFVEERGFVLLTLSVSTLGVGWWNLYVET